MIAKVVSEGRVKGRKRDHETKKSPFPSERGSSQSVGRGFAQLSPYVRGKDVERRTILFFLAWIVKRIDCTV